MKLLSRSWKIAQIKGVEIKLHISMLLVLPLIVSLFHPQSAQAWLWAFGWMLGLLLSILLHESGHTLAAKIFGLNVQGITLWLLGGFTQLSHKPHKPVHNLVISAAGPLVSLLLTIILGGLWLTQLFFSFDPSAFDLIFSLAIMNLVLLVFNLLPIYPLDGGEMLNTLGEMVFGKSVANIISIFVGIPFLLGLIVFSVIYGDYVLLVVCLLLILGVGTLNPRSQRWISLGINYVFKRTGYYLMQGDYDSAVQAYTKTLAKNPQDVPSLLGRAIAYLNITEMDLAQSDLAAVLEIAPEHVTALEFQGEIYGLKKEYETALEMYERVKTLKPDWGLPYFDCGSVHLDHNRYEAALHELDRAIELLPQVPLFYLVRSMTQYRLQHFELAQQDQAEALRLSSKDALTMSEVNLTIYEGYLDWAEDYYNWVIEKHPRQWLAYQGRGDARQVNKQLIKAIADYDQALQLAPEVAILYLRRGIAYQDAGNISQAKDDFRSAQKFARLSHIRRRATQLLDQM